MPVQFSRSPIMKSKSDSQEVNRTYKPLKEGDVVRIRGNKDWKDKGVVIEKTKYPRSYVVENQRGNRVRRNRRHLIPTMEEMKYEVESDEDTVVYDSPVVENQLLEGRADADAAVEQQVDFNLEDKRAASTTTRSGRTSKMPSRYKDYV